MRPVLCGAVGRLWRGYDTVMLVLDGFRMGLFCCCFRESLWRGYNVVKMGLILVLLCMEAIVKGSFVGVVLGFGRVSYGVILLLL